MKNLLRIMALMLCVVFTAASALAQGTDYTMGQPTTDAFMHAFASGKLVSAGVRLDLEMDAENLGLSEEEAQMMEAVLDILRQAELTVGAGLIDQGARFALEAEMTDAAGANPVSVGALADVTLEGIALESDLLPGKRVSVKWETLLALCGVPQSDIDMIMSVREMDPYAVIEAIEAVVAEIAPVIEMAAQMAMPYAETVIGYVLSLPIEVKENLNEEGYPPTATEISVTITEKDVGVLITLLCDQLAQDNTMMVLLDAMLAQMEAGMSAEEFVADARDAAAEWTNTEMPVSFFLGMNEDGLPMYAEMYIVNEPTGESVYSGLFLYEGADGIWTAEALLGGYDEENTPVFVVYLGGNYQGDPEDENVSFLQGEFYIQEEEQTLAEMALTVNTAREQDSELPAYDMDMAMSMYFGDGIDTVQAVVGAKAHQAMTAAGGEKVTGSTNTDVYVNGEAQMTSETVEQVIEPTADGGVTGYTKVSETMPAAGVKKLDMLIAYASEAIDPAASMALEQLAIEEMSEAQMNSLLQEVMIVAMQEKLPVLMANMPAQLLDAMMAEAAE